MTTYSLDDADKWLYSVSKGMEKAAMRGLLSAGIRTVQYIIVIIIPSLKPPPINRGVYRAAWRVVPIKGGASVENTLPVAILIEKGVRGENVKIGRKMIEALTEWVRMKGIGGHLTSLTSTVGKGKRAREVTKVFLIKANTDEAEKIAWAIAQNMKKNGIFNHGMGFGVLAKAMERVPIFVRDEVIREIRKEFES